MSWPWWEDKAIAVQVYTRWYANLIDDFKERSLRSGSSMDTAVVLAMSKQRSANETFPSCRAFPDKCLPWRKRGEIVKLDNGQV